jgi:hypothetical protein
MRSIPSARALAPPTAAAGWKVDACGSLCSRDEVLPHRVEGFPLGDHSVTTFVVALLGLAISAGRGIRLGFAPDLPERAVDLQHGLVRGCERGDGRMAGSQPDLQPLQQPVKLSPTPPQPCIGTVPLLRFGEGSAELGEERTQVVEQILDLMQRGGGFVENRAHALQIGELAGLAKRASLPQQAGGDCRQRDGARGDRGNARRVHGTYATPAIVVTNLPQALSRSRVM